MAQTYNPVVAEVSFRDRNMAVFIYRRLQEEARAQSTQAPYKINGPQIKVLMGGNLEKLVERARMITRRAISSIKTF